MGRKFRKYPSNYVKATAYYVPETQMSDWKQIARAYAQKVGAELLFVNENSFGIEYPDGTMQHIRVEDLQELLRRRDDIEACGSVECSTKIQGSSEDGMHTSGFSFDFIHDGNYSSEAIKNILFDIFEENNCEFLGIDFEGVDYSNSPEYRDYKVSQAGIDFRWFSLDGYDEDEIISQVEDRMYEIGYEVIGNPKFYSLEG